MSLSWGVRAFFYAEEESLDNILQDQIRNFERKRFHQFGKYYSEHRKHASAFALTNKYFEDY
jgi:hypothetical protein